MYFETDSTMNDDLHSRFREKLRTAFYEKVHSYAESIELVERKGSVSMACGFLLEAGHDLQPPGINFKSFKRSGRSLKQRKSSSGKRWATRRITGPTWAWHHQAAERVNSRSPLKSLKRASLIGRIARILPSVSAVDYIEPGRFQNRPGSLFQVP